jgi:hypothetical protein
MIDEFPAQEFELLKIPVASYIFFVYLESDKLSEETIRNKSNALVGIFNLF